LIGALRTLSLELKTCARTPHYIRLNDFLMMGEHILAMLRTQREKIASQGHSTE